MRSLWIGVLVPFLVLAIPTWSQQTTSSQASQLQTPAPQDPQAVSVLDHAVMAIGGASAINAIVDYTASGDVTYYWDQEEQGTIKIQGLGLTEIRADANLPSGTFSESIQNGQTTRKKWDGSIFQYPPSYEVPSSEAITYQPSLFPSAFTIPHLQIMAILNSPRYSLSYKGTVQLDGQSVLDVLAWRSPRGNATLDNGSNGAVEFFIDSSTFQIVMVQENTPTLHQVRYSKYIQVGSVLVPTSISETTGGQKTRDIQLNQISFNTGLQDSSFVIL